MEESFLARAESVIIDLVQRIAFAGVMGMVAIGSLTMLDVIVLRAVFNSPIPGSNEFLSTIFAVAIAAVLPSGLSQHAILEVDLLANRLGKRASAWLRTVGSALFFCTVVLISWRVGVYTYDAHMRGMRTVILAWPLSPFLWVITFLFVLCAVVQFVNFLRTVETVRTSGRDNSQITTNGAVQAHPGKSKHENRPVAGIVPTAALVLVLVGAAALLIYFGITALNPIFQTYETHTILAILILVGLWVLTLLLMPLAAGMVVCSLIGIGAIMGFSQGLSVLGSETVGLITSADLAVIPLFLMMAGFAVAGGLADDIFRLAQCLLGFLRGGMALSTIAGCAGFGALTGSSIATVAAIGGVAIDEMNDRGYSQELSSGVVTAGATLGQLVPPSTAIVVYALLTEQSIGRLYIAVLVPALITAIFYMAAVAITIIFKPSSAPQKDPFDGRKLVHAFKGSFWVFFMFTVVIGGIYTGIFTVTEASSVGAVIAFLVALFRGRLKKGQIGKVAGETTRSTAMLYFLIIGALVVSFFLGTSGLAEAMTTALINSELSNVGVVLILVLIYLLLGMAMDSFAIMITTAPLTVPIIISFGYDPIWWGIVMVVAVEMGVVTPPFGLNLFTMSSVAPQIPLKSIYLGVLPFIAVDLVKLVLLIVYPSLVLWLVYTSFI